MVESKLLLWRGFADALAGFQETLAQEPEAAAVWANTTDALLRAGRPREALDHIRVAMDFQPDDRGYFPFVAGNAHFALGELDEAQAAFTSAVRRNPDYCVAFRGWRPCMSNGGAPARPARQRAVRGCRTEWTSAMHVLGPHVDHDLTARWAQAWLRAGVRPTLHRIGPASAA